MNSTTPKTRIPLALDFAGKFFQERLCVARIVQLKRIFHWLEYTGRTGADKRVGDGGAFRLDFGQKMELREFAETVLFGTSLELKLACPALITDEQPGLPMEAPLEPGRPSELQFKRGESGKADFPGLGKLDNERERGRLLHFFANHELLATELMALVLLRFPKAPADFRRGVLRTLKDEQAHTRLYLERMRECGVQFGELPVSGYFWRSVSPMENPMDYVASLCLTFEQANLDFCRHFAQGFKTAGDDATAKLLDGIYRDEIHHVAYGLKWFRRWKNPQESDWEAFCRQLKFPLSPQRAKGLTLNVAGRRAAGLAPDFIAELNVYSQSKGRTPGVFVFNPFSEAYIAKGKSFTPVKHQQQMANDLGALPQFLCQQDDVVLVRSKPATEFLSSLKQAGFVLPEFVTLEKGRIGPKSNLRERRIGSLRPWAWGPDSIELLQPIFSQVTGGTRQLEECFNEEIAALYSKAWSAKLLRKLLEHRTNVSWLCTEEEVGVPVGNLKDALKVIAAIRGRGHQRIVAKEALGLAGHNSIRLWESEVLEAQKRWLESAVARGKEVVMEPWLERTQDFSVQFEMGPRELTLCGFTGLITDARGQFKGNWAASNHRRSIPAAVWGGFKEYADIVVRMRELYEEIAGLLEPELRTAGYVGPIGVDAFVCRTPRNTLRLKPIVEVNPRYTMGRLTVELMKHACPGANGLFRIVSHAEIQACGYENFPAYAAALTKRHPLRLEGEPRTRIREGVVCLNDPDSAQACLAVFCAGPDLTTLPALEQAR